MAGNHSVVLLQCHLVARYPECPECNGLGLLMTTACCGHVTPSGECLGYCAVQDCSLCHPCQGTGLVRDPATWLRDGFLQ